MEFYAFAATAIPVLWAASRLIQPRDVPSSWQATGWLGIKLVLITGEVSAAVVLGRRHDSLPAAWLCISALVVGAVMVAAPAIGEDMARLGIQTSWRAGAAVSLVLCVGWIALAVV